MSKGGESAPAQTVTQRTEIPQFLQPFLTSAAGISESALGGLSNLLSGAGAEQLVAPFSPDQQRAIELTRGLAGGEGGFVPTAQQGLLETARGDFLFGGQGFNEAVDAATRFAQPRILSAFGLSGGGTGGLAQAAIGQSIADAFAGQFSQERGRQLQALGALPGIGGVPAQLLAGIGDIQQQQAQRELTAPISAQQQLFGAAAGALPTSSLLGGTSTSTTAGGGGSPLAGALGGGLAGLALGGAGLPGATGLAAFGGPVGIGLGLGGALLGGLLS